MTMNAAIVVITKNRIDKLFRLLASLEQQTVSPEQLILVNAGKYSIYTQLVGHINIPLTYIDNSHPTSLSQDKNKALHYLKPHITNVCFLDDDLVLEAEALERMLKFLETAPEVAGASFNIVDKPDIKPSWYRRLFLLDSSQRGRVLASGHHTGFNTNNDTLFAQWLPGGCTMWRRAILHRFPFDEWYQGAGYWEDVDHSYTIGNHYKLAVVSSARIWHCPEGGSSGFSGQWHFVNKHHLSKLAFLWSLVGEILIALCLAIRRRKVSYLRRLSWMS